VRGAGARVERRQARPDTVRAMAEVQLSFCVVNTARRDLLVRGLDAIGREREALPFASEAIVLDNCSDDGSAQAAEAHAAVDRVIALPRRQGKAQSDSRLLREARGVYALLLNEDTELAPGAALALHDALQRDPRAACAGAALRRPDGSPQACAWRFPTVWTALAGALFLHRAFTVQSGGTETRTVDWCQSSALLVRRSAAEAVGFLDPDFFVYSDEVDFARRLRDAGWRSLHVPAAVAVHHEQLSTGAVPERRIVEFARNRDLYMRKHHGRAQTLVFRWLTALPYLLRSLAALALRGHSARRYLRHATATLRPSRGDGLREAAEAYNRALGERAAGAHSQGGGADGVELRGR
jgi:N-acetylglucosaminyl-diphospho-decaprenol L-rhamnosyltransferase